MKQTWFIREMKTRPTRLSLCQCFVKNSFALRMGSATLSQLAFLEKISPDSQEGNL